MTYWYSPHYTGHKRNYNNPLYPHKKLWELVLLGYAYGFKRRTTRGLYLPYRFSMKNCYKKYRPRYRHKANPLFHRFQSKYEIRYWGKFYK